MIRRIYNLCVGVFLTVFLSSCGASFERHLESGQYAKVTEFFDNLDLDDEDLESDCTTVGGWATENIGAMPVAFDSFDYEQFTILVKHVDDNHRITRLLILEHTWHPKDEDE